MAPAGSRSRRPRGWSLVRGAQGSYRPLSRALLALRVGSGCSYWRSAAGNLSPVPNSSLQASVGGAFSGNLWCV